jgi:hypothetical protein
MVGAFAAGAVVGWMAHAKSLADPGEPFRPWAAGSGDTVYPPTDSRGFDEGDPDVPDDSSLRAPNLDDVIDPEIAAASRHDVKHGTSVADQAWAVDPIRRAH